jgi:hypothetical protein
MGEIGSKRQESILTSSARTSLHFVWCVPRSRSTAFEKMMANSKQFNVVGEPFIDFYKQGLLSADDFLKAQTNFNDTFASLLHSSLGQTVFVKDMAYHATEFISDSHIISAKHTFLIRNPQLSIPSLYKMRNNFQANEVGFEGQYKLFKRVLELTKTKPFVMDAEILIKSPQNTVKGFFDFMGHPMPDDILDWQPGSRKDWEGRESWHIDAINSSGFTDGKTDVNLRDLPSRVTKIILKNMPYYNLMREKLSS